MMRDSLFSVSTTYLEGRFSENEFSSASPFYMFCAFHYLRAIVSLIHV